MSRVRFSLKICSLGMKCKVLMFSWHEEWCSLGIKTEVLLAWKDDVIMFSWHEGEHSDVVLTWRERFWYSLDMKSDVLMFWCSLYIKGWGSDVLAWNGRFWCSLGMKGVILMFSWHERVVVVPAVFLAWRVRLWPNLLFQPLYWILPLKCCGPIYSANHYIESYCLSVMGQFILYSNK